jgi:cell division septation protein DedD
MDMNDEAFHEIQLNGKQLVFLFMAATVVSVVIFLCGVMVGRGVRTGAPATSAEAAASVEPGRADGAAAVEVPAAAGNANVPATTTPPEPAEGSDYYDQLTRPEAGKPERVAPVEEAPAKVQARAEPDRPAPALEPVAPPEKAPAKSAEPAERTASVPASVTGSGFVVQIAALRDRTEADAIVKRLAGKGYQAFVVNPVPGKPPVYKVQVGRFAERGAADKIAARLKSEEQFRPWVTR